jgi:hypothetical protein
MFFMREDKLTRVRNLPTNSRINPYSMRSPLSTCRKCIQINTQIKL